MDKTNAILPQLLKLIKNLSEEEQRKLYRELLKRPIKRKHLRFQCRREIGYAVDGIEYVDRLRDMSYEGLFIETDRKFTTGQKIVLEIPVGNSSRVHQTTGVIVRTVKDGIGIKLTKNKLED